MNSYESSIITLLELPTLPCFWMALCFFCSVDESECDGPLDNVHIPSFRGDGVRVRPPPPTWHGDGGGDPNREKLFVFNYVCTALIKRTVNFDLKGQGAIPSGSVLINLRVCDCCCKAFNEIEEHFVKISNILKDLKASKESILKARRRKTVSGGNPRNATLGDTSHMEVEMTLEGDETEMKIVPNLFPGDESGDHLNQSPLSISTISIKDEPLAFDDNESEDFNFPECDIGKVSFQEPHTSSNIIINTSKKAQPADKERTFCRFCAYTHTKRTLSIRSHEKQKHGDKLIYKCDGCEEGFYSKEIAEEHSKLHLFLVYPMNCGICGKTRTNKSEHKVHILNYHVPRDDGFVPLNPPQRNYFCKMCDIYFPSIDEKNSHFNEHHKKNVKGKICCDIPGCTKEFLNRQRLTVHLLHPSHSQGNEGEESPVQTCKVCGKCFISEILLNRHEYFHKLYDGSGRTLICPHCDLPFFPNEDDKLKNHLSRMHPQLEGRGRHPCTVQECGASFKNRCTLKYHETTKHPELLVHKCSYQGCDTAYSELYYLETHLRTHKPAGSGSYFCTVPLCKCSKKDYFLTAEALRAHLAAHNGENVAPKASCPCPECGETFSDNSKLRCHRVEVHGIEGLGSFPCTLCSLKFGTQNRLALHQGKDHADEIETTYPCPICQKSFYPESQLTRHMKYHPPKQKKIEFPCEYCGKLVRNIRRHVHRKHRGDEVNKKVCYFCGKRVHTNNEMVEHLGTHTKERPCICPNFKSCGKDFTQPHCLKTHLKRCGK